MGLTREQKKKREEEIQRWCDFEDSKFNWHEHRHWLTNKDLNILAAQTILKYLIVPENTEDEWVIHYLKCIVFGNKNGPWNNNEERIKNDWE